MGLHDLLTQLSLIWPSPAKLFIHAVSIIVGIVFDIIMMVLTG